MDDVDFGGVDDFAAGFAHRRGNPGSGQASSPSAGQPAYTILEVCQGYPAKSNPAVLKPENPAKQTFSCVRIASNARPPCPVPRRLVLSPSAAPLLDYLELLDWTARQSRGDRGVCTPKDLPAVVQRLGLSGSAWCELVDRFARLFHHVPGRPPVIDRLRSHRRGGRFRVHRRVRELMPALE